MASTKLRKVSGADEAELKVDMSPMIDLVFLLLIFFIVVSTVKIVQQDPKIKPPVANASKSASDGKGRIVVNIREDGELLTEGLKDLPDDDAITKYVKEKKEEIDAKGETPVVHLRGDKLTQFKHVRKVIKASAAGGVDKVVFAVFPFEKN